MKSLQLTSFGEPSDVIEFADVEPSLPGANDVTVAVEAAPINPSDLLLIRGTYGVRPELPAGAGAEAVGRILAVGEDVDKSRLGERVIIVPRRGYATWREQTTVKEVDAIPVDANADALQLAMLGINPMTAYSMLHSYVKLRTGAWVAQTGASSATARHVIALARHAGLRTLNVVRRESAIQPLLDAGADVVLLGDGDLAKNAAEALGGSPIDLLLDAGVVEPTMHLASLMRVGGVVINYAARDGKPLVVTPQDLIFRSVTIHGYWLLNWLDSTPRATIAKSYGDLADLVADGTLYAPVEATYRLGDYRAAISQAALDGNASGRDGKVLFSFEG
jgi:NADPH:quinone reductase-like Zn-dependent oxidoreductase